MRKLLLVLLLAVPAFGSKPNPADFTIQATVTEVTSRPESSFRMANGTGRTRNYTVFIMTTEIGDRVYDLQGHRLDVGTYQVRKKGDKIGFLSADKKGKPVEIDLQIVGERKK